MPNNTVIIGAGISGLSAACYLANKGYPVTVLEKNSYPGGRAGQIQSDGFTFDLGPSWYWMPDIFESFFNHFSKSASDYYRLRRLDPAYRVYFDTMDYIDIPASEQELYALFDRHETNGGKKLKSFLSEAEIKYHIGINDFARRPGLSIFEFMDKSFLRGVFKLDMFKSVTSSIDRYFSNERLKQILQFPVIFLGSAPNKTPALYTLMNYADLILGTWYPMGGLYKIPEAMADLAKSLGVTIKYNTPVERIEVNNKTANAIHASDKTYHSDILIGSADYQHIEHQLLPDKYQVYTNKYWEKRVMAPSAILIYLGVNKKVDNLLHHNLFFDVDFNKHADEIYKSPKWPDNPSLYVSCTSKTDEGVAPEGHENLVILIPVATGLQDSDEIREHYYHLAIERIEKRINVSFKSNITFRKIFSHRDFISAFNSYKGNAYGLANTLFQTAIFKPSIRSKKVKNLFYTGQLTVPGPGVPPALLSGEMASHQIEKQYEPLINASLQKEMR